MANALAGLYDGANLSQSFQNTFDNSRLNRLAGEAYSAPQNQRQAILGQIASINPKAAQAQQQQWQSDEDRTLKQLTGAARYLKGAMDTNNPQAVQGAWRTVLPGLIRGGVVKDGELSPTWDPAYADTVHQVLAMGDGQGGTGTQPTQFTALDLQAKAAGYQPGTQGYQDFFKRANGELARQSGAAIGYQKITGPDGREYLVATDPRGIGAQVVGDGTGYGSFGGLQQGGVSQAAPQRTDMEADIELANSMIAAGIPEAQVDAFLAQRGQRASAASAGTGVAVPAVPGSAAGNPFASRRPEDQAAATERAKQEVQLQYLPAELNTRTDAAIRQARGTEMAKGEAERANQQSTRSRDAGTALELIAEARRLLPDATGGGLAAGADAAAGFFGHATAGAQANAALKTIAGQMTSKMPRMEGPQSDRDVQMYKDMAGDVGNASLPVRIRLAALDQIERLNQKYAKSPSGGQAGPAAGAIEDGYRFRGGNPADPNNWERL